MQKAGNILLVVFIAGIIMYSGFLLWKRSQPEPARYEVLKSSIGDLERLAVFTGRILPNEEVEIKPYIGGILSEIYVSEGDYVKAGDVIALIEVIPNVENMALAQSSLNGATILFEEQEKNYERTSYLYKEGVVSDSEMEAVEAEYKNAQRELLLCQDNLNIIKKGYNETTKTGNIQVRSTISGLVISVPEKKGTVVIPVNILNKGTTIATVGDINSSEFVFNVDETEIDYIYIGMPVKINFGANDSLTVEGQINYISSMGITKKGAAFFEVRASMIVPENIFIPVRSSAKAEISIAKKNQVLLVPESTISFENDSTFVYLVEKKIFGYSYHRKPVELGLSDKTNVEVLSGIGNDANIRGNRIVEKK